MKRISKWFGALAIAATMTAPSTAQSLRVDEGGGAFGSSVLRIGQDYALKAGDSIREAVIIGGDATIEGRVDRDVVVVFGKTQLASTAIIDGSLIVVGGGVTIMPGASIGLDLVAVAGAFDAPPGFSLRGQHIVIGPAIFGGRLDGIFPWLSRGLLWGRLIVPDLRGTWTIVGVFFIGYLILNLLFSRSVGACAETLAEKPLTSFATGLLVLLLTAPLCLLLAVSVIGIPVIPLLICSLAAAMIIGKVGVARWIGMSIVGQDSQENRVQSLRSVVIGFAVLSLALMVPVLGIITWTITGGFAMGAAALAFISSYRREGPAKVPLHPQWRPAPAGAAAAGHLEGAPSGEQAHEAGASVNPLAASMTPMVPVDLASLPHARFRDRLAAFVLDVILVVIAQQLLDLTRRDSTFFLLLLAYHIGFWAWKGTTVGGIICQLRVVRVDGASVTFPDALVRGLSGIFSLAVLGIGCFWILKDPERQAWHDKIAGTYVVRVPRNWPL